MVVWGGFDLSGGRFSFFNSGGRYDPTMDSWTPTSTAGAPSARTNHTAIWTGRLMIVWGGWGTQGLLAESGGRYDPLADSWTPTSTTGAPSPRYGHAAVWTGTSMVIWSGVASVGDYFETGGLYDPFTDSWTPTS